MAAQIQLANTFNEFRGAYNDAANDITQLQEGNTLFNTVMSSGAGAGTGALYANTAQIKTFNNSGGRIVVTRAAVSGSGATLEDDAGLGFDSASNRLTVDGPLDANGAIRSTQVTANNLTSGRVAIAGTSGLLSDDAGLTFNSSTHTLTVDGPLDANGAIRSTQVTANNLTSGRILIAGASGLVTDDSGLTYNSATDAVTASGAVGVNSLSATTWANAANMNITTDLTVGANVNVGDTVNAASHLHVGGATDWIIDKEENQDVHLITAVAESDGAHDIAVVNRSNNANAYAEFIAINNAGNTETGWVSLGINATNYDQGAFAVTKGDDAYILYQAPVGTTKNGDLVIGTGGNGTTNKIIFSANGFDDPANNTQVTIEPGVRVHIEVPTQSVSTTTGALTVAGGIGVVGNMNVGGNVTITGSISLLGAGNTVSTDTLAVANSLLFLANGNSSDTLDIGVIGQYQQGAPKYFGLVRDQSDGVFKLFLDASTRPANTVNFGQAGLNYGSVQIGELYTSNTTATSSSTTGSLRVAGGAGIAGGVWAGGAIRTDSTTVSTSTSTGALIINGGAGIAGNTHIGGNLFVDSSTFVVDATNNRVGVNATNPQTTFEIRAGSPVLRLQESTTLGDKRLEFSVSAAGEARISANQSAQNLDFFLAGTRGVTFASGGNVAIYSTTSSSSTTTGALIVAGGVGVQGTVTAASLVETSSITLKENINPIDDALETVMKMLGVVYDRKDGSNKNEVGMIAEHLNEFAPNLVGKDENGNPSSIFYTRVTAYLVEAIKKLKNEIDELKGK
jgi:hypothetical protein